MERQAIRANRAVSDVGQSDQLSNESKMTEFYDAIRRREFDRVKLLVESGGVDVNAKTENGLTPLHFAAKYAIRDYNEFQELEDECVAYFIKKGAKLDAQDQNGLTPVHYAVVEDNVLVVKQLMRAGAQLDLPDNDGMTPLLMAAIKEKVGMGNHLIQFRVNYKCVDKQGNSVLHHTSQKSPINGLSEHAREIRSVWGHDALVELINLPNQKGETALHWAALVGNEPACHDLIDLGADVRLKTAQGETALHLIARATGCYTIKLLLEDEADINSEDALLQTPLFKAIEGGNFLEVELLLQRGATVNCSDYLNQTPLILAAKLGKADICAELLCNGANPFVRDAENKDALYWAVMGKHFSVVKSLMESEKGMDLLENGYSDGDSIIHVAARVGSLEITDYLIGSGCGLFGVNAFEQTAIHVAAMFGHYKVLLRMMEQSPSVAFKLDEDGNLAAHLAAKHGHPQVLRKLLEQPHVVNARNIFGWTPLMFAAANNHVDCVKLLLDQGADVDAMDKAKVTPLFVACEEGFPAVVHQLLEHGANPGHRVSDRHALYPEWRPLDVAVHKQHMHCVRLIVRGVQGKSTLDNVRKTGRGSLMNPRQHGIVQTPETTNAALTRCVGMSDEHGAAEDHATEFNFPCTCDEDILKACAFCNKPWKVMKHAALHSKRAMKDAADASVMKNRLDAMQTQITAIAELLEKVANKVNVGS